MSPDSTYGAREARLVAGRLRGYRTWWLWPSEGSLRSVSAPTIWESAQLTAECLHSRMSMRHDNQVTPHDATVVPHIDCTCGIYAAHRPENPNVYPYVSDAHNRVLGVVEATGGVLAGPLGWRARHVRIIALAVPAGTETLAIELRSVDLNAWTGSSAVTFQVLLRSGYTYFEQYDVTHVTNEVVAELRRETERRARLRLPQPHGLRHYGVPVFDDPKQMFAVYPPENIEHLVPKKPPVETVLINGRPWTAVDYLQALRSPGA